MGNMGAHIAHILFFGVPILAAAHMGVPSMFYGKILFFFFFKFHAQGFRVLPVFSKGADEFFSPPKNFFFTSA